MQYYLIYENLAKKFDHDGVIISLLPNNDFKDNDYVYYKNNNLDNFNKSPRFRPYYILDENNNFQIIYPKKSDLNYNKFKEIIKNNFWFSNVIRTIILQNESFSKQIKTEKRLIYSL